MGSPEQERRKKVGQMVAEEALDWATGLVDDAVDDIPKDAPRITRYVARSAAKAPGVVYEVGKIASAEDKGRAVAGLIGGTMGGLGGGALGAATGPAAVVAVPVGRAVGAAAGEELGERLYDAHAAQVRAYSRKVEQDLRRGAGTAKQWIAARGAQMMAPYWFVDDYHRAARR